MTAAATTSQQRCHRCHRRKFHSAAGSAEPPTGDSQLVLQEVLFGLLDVLGFSLFNRRHWPSPGDKFLKFYGGGPG